jgi:hypothetical protein
MLFAGVYHCLQKWTWTYSHSNQEARPKHPARRYLRLAGILAHQAAYSEVQGRAPATFLWMSNVISPCTNNFNDAINTRTALSSLSIVIGHLMADFAPSQARPAV